MGSAARVEPCRLRFRVAEASVHGLSQITAGELTPGGGRVGRDGADQVTGIRRSRW